MDVLWEILVFVGHAIEQVLIYVETHHWIFGFLAAAYIFTFTTEAFTRASTLSRSGSTKFASGSRSNIEGRNIDRLE